jgi:tripartite-type tricarboxylate transporter receptor subunit TctC
MRCKLAARIAASACFFLGCGIGGAAAQEDFFRGKTIRMLIGTSPGGGYDQDGRLVARHLGAHLPGNPTIVPENMPGASSLVLTNYLYNSAPRDGTALGIVNLAMPLEQFLRGPNINYDVTQFFWLGRTRAATEMAVVWHNVPVDSIRDVFTRETIMGGTGPNSETEYVPRLLNNLAGTKFRIVSGFTGIGDLGLAMERGEVEGGAAPLDALTGYRSDWLRDKKVKMLVIYTRERNPAIPDVPSMVELGKTDEAREILGLYASSSDIGRSFIAPPGLPAERAAVLRKAFDEMFADPLFVADAKAQRIDLETLGGDELQQLVLKMSQFPPSLVPKARSAAGNPQ